MLTDDEFDEKYVGVECTPEIVREYLKDLYVGYTSEQIDRVMNSEAGKKEVEVGTRLRSYVYYVGDILADMIDKGCA